MASGTVQHIISTLAKSPVPLTRTGLARDTGLSYNTIKAHIENIPGVVEMTVTDSIGNTRTGFVLNRKTKTPTGVTLSWHSKFARDSTMTIEVPLLELAAPVEMYERIASKIPLALPSRLRPDDDPLDMANAIGDYAIFLATIAAKLTEQSDNPEWYQNLGGDDGYYTP